MTVAFEPILNQLTELSTLLGQFNEQLRQDEKLVSNNKISALDKGNEQKQILLNSLTNALQQIQRSINQSEPTEKPLSLVSYIQQLDGQKAEKAKKILSVIHHDLTEGYELLIKNNNIIISNLGFIRDFLTKLTGATANVVYEKPGLTSSK